VIAGPESVIHGNGFSSSGPAGRDFAELADHSKFHIDSLCRSGVKP